MSQAGVAFKRDQLPLSVRIESIVLVYILLHMHTRG